MKMMNPQLCIIYILIGVLDCRSINYLRQVQLQANKIFTTSTIFISTIIKPSYFVQSQQHQPEKTAVNFERIFPPFSRNDQREDSGESHSTHSGTSFVRNAVRTVGPSVVRIDCERDVSQLLSLFSPDQNKEGDLIKVSGTGIIASTDGYILTNAHVIEQARKVTITLSNGRSYKAEVVSYDEFTDLAVIKADLGSNGPLVKAPIGDSSLLQSGDWVIAVGCPVGLDFTVTLGVVSSPKRSAAEVGAPHLKGSYIQTDAALNSGNSGGPLVNDNGQVVGINTMVRTNTEAIGFAIPINRAMQIYDILKIGKKPTHAYFGLEIMSISPDYARINNEDPNSHQLPEVFGALVMKVSVGSPADRCGLRKNDVIVEINRESINNADIAETELDHCKPSKSSTLVVIRGENKVKCELEVVPLDLYTVMEERKKKLLQPFMMSKP
eukprot:gene5685-7847_t